MNLKRILFLLLAGPFVATSVLSQTPASSSTVPPSSVSAENGVSNALPSRTAIPVALSKSIDAKKAKSGDPIEARTTMDLLFHGQIVVPRDAKIMGRVTTATSRSKEAPESNLGIAFDHILMKDGRDLPIHVTVQAIGRPLSEVELGSFH